MELTTRVDGDERFDPLTLNSALVRLKVLDAQLAELVEMRYFGVMTVEDVALATGLSEPTINRLGASGSLRIRRDDGGRHP